MTARGRRITHHPPGGGLLLLFDQAVSGRESAAKSKLTEALAERARGGEDRQALLDEILTIGLDPDVGDEQIGVLLRERVGMDRLRAGVGGTQRAPAARPRAPGDAGRLNELPAPVRSRNVVGKPTAGEALAQADDELHTALGGLESHLARGADGEVRLTDDGGLVIPPLTAEDIPAEADALRTELAGLLPRVPLASVLVELDARTGFTDQLIHAGGKVNRPPELRRNLLYVVIAEATNMGLGAMAESCGVLAWTVAYAGEGAVRRRHHEQQTEQMWCLTLATNAIVTWTTEYHGLAVAALRRGGRWIDDEVLAHIWPTHHENVHFYGTHSVDIDGELAKLDADGYRPHRRPGRRTTGVPAPAGRAAAPPGRRARRRAVPVPGAGRRRPCPAGTGRLAAGGSSEQEGPVAPRAAADAGYASSAGGVSPFAANPARTISSSARCAPATSTPVSAARSSGWYADPTRAAR